MRSAATALVIPFLPQLISGLSDVTDLRPHPPPLASKRPVLIGWRPAPEVGAARVRSAVQHVCRFFGGVKWSPRVSPIHTVLTNVLRGSCPAFCQHGDSQRNDVSRDKRPPLVFSPPLAGCVCARTCSQSKQRARFPTLQALVIKGSWNKQACVCANAFILLRIRFAFSPSLRCPSRLIVFTGPAEIPGVV